VKQKKKNFIDKQEFNRNNKKRKDGGENESHFSDRKKKNEENKNRNQRIKMCRLHNGIAHICGRIARRIQKTKSILWIRVLPSIVAAVAVVEDLEEGTMDNLLIAEVNELHTIAVEGSAEKQLHVETPTTFAVEGSAEVQLRLETPITMNHNTITIIIQMGATPTMIQARLATINKTSNIIIHWSIRSILRVRGVKTFQVLDTADSSHMETSSGGWQPWRQIRSQMVDRANFGKWRRNTGEWFLEWIRRIEVRKSFCGPFAWRNNH
jgi:hypothetical protein